MSEATMSLIFKALMLPCGIMWTAVYILIIYKGFKDKSYGMPLAAFCANVAWEAIFAVAAPWGSHSIMQTAINYIWLGFDLIILAQIIMYAPREFKGMSKAIFYPLFAIGIVFGFCVVYFTSIITSDPAGAYAAFGQNMMMSMLFVTMLFQRGSTRGQMVWIAALKFGGTLLSSIAFCFFDPEFGAFSASVVTSAGEEIVRSYATNPLMLTFYIGIFVFDLLYLVLLILVKKGKIRFSQNVVAAA